MAQNGIDMPATGDFDATVAVPEDTASNITQAETTTMPEFEEKPVEAMEATANESVQAVQDGSNVSMRPDHATVDTSAQDAPPATDDTPMAMSDEHTGLDRSVTLSDNVDTSLPPTAVGETGQAAATTATFAQDLLSLAGAMSNQDSVPTAVIENGTNDVQDSAKHDLAMSGNEQTDALLSGQVADARTSENGIAEGVPAVTQPSGTNTGEPDVDIEEGEELDSAPPPQIEQDIPREQQEERSSSVATSSRRREGRSRSPNRERRPSPQRGPIKPPVNRDELFKVYIGGLPEKTELADLEDCFGQFGEIGHVELKLGYAFIEFVTQEGAKEAIDTYNEGHFLGKMIKVEASKSATTQQESIDKGTCFTCGEHGHFAKHCPQDPRNANRRRAPMRDRSPPPFGRDRRDFRDRDRPFIARDRDREAPRRDFDRDAAKRFPPRDDRRDFDRRRDRDFDRDRERGPRDLDRSRGPAGPGGRYIEPHTRDSHRNITMSHEPVGLKGRELLDQQRDRERQLRRLAEMDPNFVPPPPASAGYPPRGAPTDPALFPPGPPPPHVGSPYYPPYGSQQLPPDYPLPPGRLPPGIPPFGMPPNMPGSSSSPPLYPPRGDVRVPYTPSSAYPPNIPPRDRQEATAAPGPYYRMDGPPPSFREDQNGGYDRRNAPPVQRERFEDNNGQFPPRGQGYPPRGDPSFLPPTGNERPPLDSSIPPNNAPPFYYDRPPAGWGAPPGGIDRQGASSPPFDDYGRPPPSYIPQGGPNQDYNKYRSNNGDQPPYDFARDRR